MPLCRTYERDTAQILENMKLYPDADDADSGEEEEDATTAAIVEGIHDSKLSKAEPRIGVDVGEAKEVATMGVGKQAERMGMEEQTQSVGIENVMVEESFDTRPI